MSVKSVLFIVTATVVTTVAVVIYVQTKLSQAISTELSPVKDDALETACSELLDRALDKGTIEAIHLAECIVTFKDRLDTRSMMSWEVSLWLYTIRKISSEIQTRPVTTNDVSIIQAFVT